MPSKVIVIPLHGKRFFTDFFFLKKTHQTFHSFSFLALPKLIIQYQIWILNLLVYSFATTW